MSHTRTEADAPHHETARVDPEESCVCSCLQRDPRGRAHGGRVGLLGSRDTGHAHQQAQRLGLQGHVSWGSMPCWAGGRSMAKRPNVVNGAELVLCFHHNKRKEKCVDRQSVLQGPVWVQRKGCLAWEKRAAVCVHRQHAGLLANEMLCAWPLAWGMSAHRCVNV